jgi:hypothetical protein
MELIDQDIAHIARVMMPSMQTASGIPILPPEYWHKRLSELLDTGCLSNSQFWRIDQLMTQIERMQSSAAFANERAAA